MSLPSTVLLPIVAKYIWRVNKLDWAALLSDCTGFFKRSKRCNSYRWSINTNNSAAHAVSRPLPRPAARARCELAALVIGIGINEVLDFRALPIVGREVPLPSWECALSRS